MTTQHLFEQHCYVDLCTVEEFLRTLQPSMAPRQSLVPATFVPITFSMITSAFTDVDFGIGGFLSRLIWLLPFLVTNAHVSSKHAIITVSFNF